MASPYAPRELQPGCAHCNSCSKEKNSEGMARRTIAVLCIAVVLCETSRSSCALARFRPRGVRARHGVEIPGCLRLFGGKIKYKDLRVVKEAREEGLRVKGENLPPKMKHRSGARVRDRLAAAARAVVHVDATDERGEENLGQRQPREPLRKKVRGGRRVRKKAPGGADHSTPDAAVVSNAGADRVNVDEWAGLGDGIYYGNDEEPADSDEKLRQWELEEEEVQRMAADRKAAFAGDAGLQSTPRERAFQAFPSDSESSEMQEGSHSKLVTQPSKVPPSSARDLLHKSSNSCRLNSTYLDTVFRGNSSLSNSPQGLGLLVVEMEQALHALRSCIEPLLLRCRVLGRHSDGLASAEMLLAEKYLALLSFVIGIQDKVLFEISAFRHHDPSARIQRGRLDFQLDVNWRRLVEIRKLEDLFAQGIQKMLAKAALLPPPAVSAVTEHNRDNMDEGMGRFAEDGGIQDAVEREFLEGARDVRGVREKLSAQDREDEGVRQAAIASHEERELEEKMKLLNMVEDDALALKYGHKWWFKKYAGAKALEAAAARGEKMNEEQLYKISRMQYLYSMWRRAYRLTFPEIRGDPRRPTGGDTVIMEGGRRPAPLEILTNVRGTRRTRRSRKDSNPRVRLRHRFHDLVVRTRGSQPAMRSEGSVPGGYRGEPTGINPKASRSLAMGWTKMQHNSKRKK